VPKTNRIINVLCYSYKGGSGRSTATVNLAFELVRLGKLVACVDMDFGAPGMHMIISEFAPKEELPESLADEQIGVQDFFNQATTSSNDLSSIESAIYEPHPKKEWFLFNDFLQDSESGRKTREDGGHRPDGRLLCAFSSTAQRVPNDLTKDERGVARFVEKYHHLQEALANRLRGKASDYGREVYILVDSPSGITPVSLPLFRCSDLILVFYRYSLQHVRGTIQSARKMRYYLMPEIERRFLRMLLVGSCYPEDLVRELMNSKIIIPEGSYADDMLHKFEKIQEELEDFSDIYSEIVKLREPLVEDDILKILEQPLVSTGIRRSLLGYSDRADQDSSQKTREKIQSIALEIINFGDQVLEK
jgi:MinD-like ATPase involved in chromosome partitioning or flagellar assembly